MTTHTLNHTINQGINQGINSALSPGEGFGVLGVASTAELTIRMVVALAVITVVLLVGTRLARRVIGQRAGDGPRIVIEHQHQLSKHTTLTLLTAGETHLLIAANNQTTTLLAQGPQLTTPTTNTNTTTNTTGTPTTTGTGTGTGTPTSTTTGKPNTTGKPPIDIRTKPNPIKTLQNKTLRR